MFRQMFRGKIHRATVTKADVDYMGSITIDEALLEAADIAPYERVQVVDIDNGARLETYAIPAPAGSGEVQVNGAAARLVNVGDRVIIIAYSFVPESEVRNIRPRVVHVDAQNRLLAPLPV
ncbi:MAG: aspartate 1-decarboxylase [Chloroflexota bacterium]|nr:aspartate 1-decarboxylase [Dehalococcoidia bacterium]MDW8252707.1 aspartate 1-decarboxylase [Chloroflexota bacterium]